MKRVWSTDAPISNRPWLTTGTASTSLSVRIDGLKDGEDEGLRSQPDKECANPSVKKRDAYYAKLDGVKI